MSHHGASSLPKQFVDDLKKYMDDARLFLDALGELQGQLELIESGVKSGGTTVSTLLKEIVEKDPATKTPRFEAYMNGRLPVAGRPDLAWRIEENLKLLTVLCKEMNSYVSNVELLQESMHAGLEAAGARGNEEKASTVVEGGGESEGNTVEDQCADATWSEISGANIIAAAIAEGLRKNYNLFEKVAGAISVLTSGDEVGAYLTVLSVRPYLHPELLNEVLQLPSSSQGQLSQKKAPTRDRSSDVTKPR